MSNNQVVLFLRNVNGESKWFEVSDVKIWIRVLWKMFTNGKYLREWKYGRIIYTSTTFFDGRKYVGEYNGVPNGQGTMIFENGHKYEGEWKNGEEWKGTRYDKDGDIDYKVVNGVRQ